MRYTIPFAAIGAPRMSYSDRWKKRPRVLAYHSWKDALRAYMRDWPPADKVNRVVVVAYFKPVKKSESVGSPMRKRPDVDNICKAVLDTLWEQDQMIPAVNVEKLYGMQDMMIIEIT